MRFHLCPKSEATTARISGSDRAMHALLSSASHLLCCFWNPATTLRNHKLVHMWRPHREACVERNQDGQGPQPASTTRCLCDQAFGRFQPELLNPLTRATNITGQRKGVPDIQIPDSLLRINSNFMPLSFRIQFITKLTRTPKCYSELKRKIFVYICITESLC